MLLIVSFTINLLQAQSIYTRQPFGSTVYDSYQVVKKSYYPSSGEVVGPVNGNYRITGSGNTVYAYTSFGSTTEKLVLLIAQKDWLDLTNSIVVSGTGVTLSRIIAKGVDGRGTTTQKAWVHFELNISPSAAPGNRTVRLIRPAAFGTDENTFTLNLKQNARMIYQSAFKIANEDASARLGYLRGVEVRITFEGHRLHLVKGIRNNGNNMTSSIINNLRLVERGPSKLVFAMNIVKEGNLSYKDFALRYLDMETGSNLFNLNCLSVDLCNFIKTTVDPSQPLTHIYLVYPSDAERGIN